MIGPVPAASEVDGTWRLRYETEAGPVDTTTTFRTEGTKLLLVIEGEEKVVGTHENGRIDFLIPDGLPEVGFTGDLIVKATIRNGKLTGEYEFVDYAGPVTGTRQ